MLGSGRAGGRASMSRRGSRGREEGTIWYLKQIKMNILYLKQINEHLESGIWYLKQIDQHLVSGTWHLKQIKEKRKKSRKRDCQVHVMSE